MSDTLSRSGNTTNIFKLKSSSLEQRKSSAFKFWDNCEEIGFSLWTLQMQLVECTHKWKRKLQLKDGKIAPKFSLFSFLCHQTRVVSSHFLRRWIRLCVGTYVRTCKIVMAGDCFEKIQFCAWAFNYGLSFLPVGFELLIWCLR